jgi:hypothetical protein
MHILLGILIFKGLTARRLFKSFGFKGLKCEVGKTAHDEDWLFPLTKARALFAMTCLLGHIVVPPTYRSFLFQ